MREMYQQIFTQANVLFLLKGLAMTVEISCIATLLSMCFGTLLALVRTYAGGRLRILGNLVAAYTEFFRFTPNLLWILWLYFTVRGNCIVVSVLAITLFTSAVMCEIFRGGLNAIPKEQFEAAQSQGFGFHHPAADVPEGPSCPGGPDHHGHQGYFVLEDGGCAGADTQRFGHPRFDL